MDNLAADFTIENNNPLEVSYELGGSNIDCVFEIYAAGTVWGSINGDINNQTDLINILNTKVDLTSFEDLTQTVENNYTVLDTKIDGVNSELSENIGELETNLTNLSNTVTSNNTDVNNRIDTTNTNLTNLTATVTYNNIAINNRVDGIVTSFDEDIEGINTVISNLETTVTDNNTAINNRVNTLEISIDADIEELNTYLSDLSDTVGDNYTDLDGKVTQLGTTVSSNYTTLDTKIDSVNTNLSSDIQDLETDLTGLSATVSTNNTAINQKVDNLETSLSEDINTLSATVTSNYTSLDTKIDNTKSELAEDIATLSGTVTSNYNDLNSAITTSSTTINSRIDNEVDDLNAAITSEATTRENANNALQSQIDAITAASDVVDIVGTYAQLQAYDTSKLQNNDIIKVLSDESRDDETTYYRWVITDGVGAWSFIGEEGPYYTKSEADGQFVPQTRTINNKPLSDNITLTASDINALPDTTVIGSGVLTLQKNGVDIDTFNANATTSKTINFEIPTTLSELTNDSGFITGISSSDIVTALGYTPYSNANPDGFITNAALSNYVTNTSLETTLTNYVTGSTLTTTLQDYALNTEIPTKTSDLTNDSGFITSAALSGYATTSDLTNGLSTKYDASNPSGFITTAALSGYATEEWVNGQGYLSDIAIDNTTITKNSSDELQAVGVIDDNSGDTIKTWVGTKEEYEALETKDNNTIYNITDDYSQEDVDTYTKSDIDTLFYTKTATDNLFYSKTAVDNLLYYKSGDSYITGTLYLGGTLTGSKGSVVFSVITPKSMKNISNITVNSLVLYLRAEGKYFGGTTSGSGGGAEASTFSTISVSKTADNIITIDLTLNNAASTVTNNIAVAVNIASSRFTFS